MLGDVLAVLGDVSDVPNAIMNMEEKAPLGEEKVWSVVYGFPMESEM